MSRLLEKYKINIWVYGFSPILGTRSRFLLNVWDIFVPWFSIFFGPCPLDLRITIYSNVDLVCSNNLDIYDYVGKLPEQHFSVWLFSNPGDKMLFLLKFNEVRISALCCLSTSIKHCSDVSAISRWDLASSKYAVFEGFTNQNVAKNQKLIFKKMFSFCLWSIEMDKWVWWSWGEQPAQNIHLKEIYWLQFGQLGYIRQN